MDPIGTGASSRSIDMAGNWYYEIAVNMAFCVSVATSLGSSDEAQAAGIEVRTSSGSRWWWWQMEGLSGAENNLPRGIDKRDKFLIAIFTWRVAIQRLATS